MTERARTIFLGSGSFGVSIVDYLEPNRWVDLVGVVTSPARPGSRGRMTDTPVGRWITETEYRGPALRPARLRGEEAVAMIVALSPDLLILADYGRIVPQAILDLPKHGALNLHPSLLPRYRGATPIPAAIMAGDSETGVTLMQMDAGLDTGPVVGQRSVSLEGTETAPELEWRLAREGADLLEELLPGWLAGDLEPQPQDDSRATMTRPLRREDGRLEPHRTAEELERQVRAYQPWPGSFIETSSGRVMVWRARSAALAERPQPGSLVALPGGAIALATAENGLVLDEVQPAGGRRMSGAEILRGRPGLAGSIVAMPPEA